MALEKRGISKFFLEDYGGAVRDLLFIDKMHGISPSSNKTLAMSLFETNLYGSAIHFFEEAIDYEPSASLYEQLGKSKLKKIEKGGFFSNVGRKTLQYCADFINAEQVKTTVDEVNHQADHHNQQQHAQDIALT